MLHQAGTIVSNEVKEILSQYFSEKDILKLERLGGKIQISITAPYVSAKQRKASRNITVDRTFIEGLKQHKDDNEKLHSILINLSVKKMKELCKLINQPIRSNANANEIRSEIVRYFQSENIWQSISGDSKTK
jgi:hypothetical protein